MHWIAPPEKDTDNAALEKRLWDTADQFRANSGLKAQEYSGPILGIIFLRFAELRFAKPEILNQSVLFSRAQKPSYARQSAQQRSLLFAGIRPSITAHGII